MFSCSYWVPFLFTSVLPQFHLCRLFNNLRSCTYGKVMFHQHSPLEIFWQFQTSSSFELPNGIRLKTVVINKDTYFFFKGIHHAVFCVGTKDRHTNTVYIFKKPLTEAHIYRINLRYFQTTFSMQ
jgi:hypothetical protein